MPTDGDIQAGFYRTLVETGRPPGASELAEHLGLTTARVREGFAELAERRLLLLEPDGVTVRMAPPFSGVPTQHRIRAGGVEYFANCAWDALGIPAALHRPAEVVSRCEQLQEPLVLRIDDRGPGDSPWLFHCLVPAARWWQDLIHT